MKKQSPLKRIFAIRGMGGALTAFAGLIIIYIAFGIINPAVFSGQHVKVSDHWYWSELCADHR